jgi:hypothetical protein
MADLNALTIPYIEKARLGSSIELYAVWDFDFDFKWWDEIKKFAKFSLGSLAILLGKDNNIFYIGGTTKFSLTQTRENYRRYSLGKNSFEPFQVIPGKITTTISIERIEFQNINDDKVRRFFIFDQRNLLFQQTPIMVIEYQTCRDASLKNLDKQAIRIYTNCWAKTNPMKYDLTTTDLLIVKNIELDVGKVIVLDTSVAGIAGTVSMAEELIPSTVDLLGKIPIKF